MKLHVKILHQDICYTTLFWLNIRVNIHLSIYIALKHLHIRVIVVLHWYYIYVRLQCDKKNIQMYYGRTVVVIT